MKLAQLPTDDPNSGPRSLGPPTRWAVMDDSGVVLGEVRSQNDWSSYFSSGKYGRWDRNWIATLPDGKDADPGTAYETRKEAITALLKANQ